MQSNLVYTEIKSSSTLYAGVTISSKARRIISAHYNSQQERLQITESFKEMFNSHFIT